MSAPTTKTAERRPRPDSGILCTKRQFVGAYGGYKEWNAAGKAAKAAVRAASAAQTSATPSPPAAVDDAAVDKLNLQLSKAEDSEAVLGAWISLEAVLEGGRSANPSPAGESEVVVSALHRLASVNKVNRAGRDRLLRDARFEALLEGLVARSPELSARGVADALWCCATLKHWPPQLLTPLLTRVNALLDSDGFEASHLTKMAWAFARLECKPVALLNKMEALALPRVGAMNAQNAANLLWGFAALRHTPGVRLRSAVASHLLSSGLLSTAKPVEVCDLAHALATFGEPVDETPCVECRALRLALAERAAADAALPDFSSRQLVSLLASFVTLGAAERLPAGRIDSWVSAVRAAHEATPLLAHDARSLEESLSALGLDGSWVKRSEVLNAWSDLAAGEPVRASRGGSFTEEELRAVFAQIDTDGSGDIDRAELTRAIREINADADEEMLQAMLDLADADGDGEISFAEFKKIMLVELPAAAPYRLGQVLIV